MICKICIRVYRHFIAQSKCDIRVNVIQHKTVFTKFLPKKREFLTLLVHKHGKFKKSLGNFVKFSPLLPSYNSKLKYKFLFVFLHTHTVQHLGTITVLFIHQLIHKWVVFKTILKFTLKFTLKQLRHVSLQSHHHQGGHYLSLLKLLLLK
jgi:hypothetical protein